MLDFEKLKGELPNLPLNEREEFARLLNQSISDDHEKLATVQETENLKIVAERIAEYEAGKTHMIPFEETMQRVFGKT